MDAPPVEILIFARDRLIHQQTLPPGDYLIGGEANADIFIYVEGLAARHATLSLGESDWQIEDLGSAAGTFVDEQRVTARQAISPSQKIRVGEATIRLRPAAGGGDARVSEGCAEVLRERLPEEARGLHKYEVGPELTHGGMGVIHDAHDGSMQRNVAMKLMRSCAVPDEVARFIQEAQITARLEHPNIVPVHELSVNERGQPFYTMKFVRGVSLGEVLALLWHGDPTTVKKYPLSALLTTFQKLCDAVAFAHSKGVIHRDLKPDNIMLGQFGEALVMDWGLAKVLGGGSVWPSGDGPAKAASTGGAAEVTMVGVTMLGTVVGTPQYMSPEQAEGENVGPATDIYALGALLYHMLALRPPIAGQDKDEVLINVRAGRIEPLAAPRSSRRLAHLPGGRIPDSLAAVVKKAMARDPGARYQRVQDLQGELEKYQSGFPTNAENASAVKLAGLFLRRHRTVSSAVGLLLIAAVIFGVNLARARNAAEAAERVATQQRNSTEDALYLSDMMQVGRHLQDGRPTVALEVLQRHRREASGRDLRDWEWFHLLGQLNLDRLRVQAHARGVYAVAASPGGGRIATGGGDGDLAIWRTRSLLPECRLHAHEGAVFAVAWQTGGPLLATGGADGVVRIWDEVSHEKVAELRISPGQAIRALAWQPKHDGSGALAIGGEDKAIRLWRAGPGHPSDALEIFHTTSSGVSSLHWSADGVRLAIGGVNAVKRVEVFDFEKQAFALSTEKLPGNHILAVALTANGQLVAVGSKHLDVAVFRVREDTPIFVQPLHRSFVSAVAWNPSGKVLASASYDGTIRLSAPLGSVRVSQVFSGHVGEVNALAWVRLPSSNAAEMPEGVLFSGGADGTLRAWTPVLDGDSSLKSTPSNWVGAARWSPDGTRVATCSFRNYLHIFDAASGVSFPIRSEIGNVFDLAWSATGDRLATAGRLSGKVAILEVATGRTLERFALAGADRVAWSPSGDFLAAGGTSETRIWNARTGELLTTIQQASGSLAWNRDERRIALGGRDGSIALWDAFSGKKIADWRAAPREPLTSIPSKEDPPRQILDLCWSVEGCELAFGAQDSTAGILATPHGRLTRTFAGHPSGVWRVTWSPDGRRVATCGQDGAVRVFEAETGNPVANFNHGLTNMELHAVDWSPDSRELLSAGYDQFVRIWDSLRGHRIDALGELERRAHDAPRKASAWCELALGYARLGSADRARAAGAQARQLSPDDPALEASEAEAEGWLAGALTGTAFRPERVAGTAALDPRALALLGVIHSSWEDQDSFGAVKACRQLFALPDTRRFQPLVVGYLSRANWEATWFASPLDPRADVDAWRALATQPGCARLKIDTLDFPYRQRSIKAFTAAPELETCQVPADRFGMIARAVIPLAAGKWRFHARGNDGIRVIVDGQAIIDDWAGTAPVERSGDFERATAGEAKVVVEHYALRGAKELRVSLELAE